MNSCSVDMRPPQIKANATMMGHRCGVILAGSSSWLDIELGWTGKRLKLGQRRKTLNAIRFEFRFTEIGDEGDLHPIAGIAVIVGEFFS